MAYGQPPSPGHGPQPGRQQSPWQGGQAPQGAWQQPPPPQGGWQQPPPSPGTAPMPGHHGPVSDDDKTWALMAYVGQFMIALFAPAIVYVRKGRSPFVRRHAAQGLNMGIASVAVWTVGMLLQMLFEPLIWLPLAFTAAIVFFLVWAARAANRGEFRQVPVFLAWPLVK
ncbi:DUF4870 domain-containing protein [Spirillospora sp. CA-253888]